MAEVDGVVLETVSSEVHPPATHGEQPFTPAAGQVSPNFSSSLDNGLSKRPRDARLIHMILANYGVTAYQERVPLQIMDFAYRYTSSVLQDAIHFTSEGYGTTGPGVGNAKAGAATEDKSPVTLSAVRLSIHSRTNYQFNPALPKEIYNDIAQERNRVALPPLQKEWGLRLPPEQYCLTGSGLDMKEDWQFEDEADGLEDDGDPDAIMKDEALVGGDDMEGESIEEGGRMEDIFGEAIEGNNGEGGMEE